MLSLVGAGGSLPWTLTNRYCFLCDFGYQLVHTGELRNRFCSVLVETLTTTDAQMTQKSSSCFVQVSSETGSARGTGGWSVHLPLQPVSEGGVSGQGGTHAPSQLIPLRYSPLVPPLSQISNLVDRSYLFCTVEPCCQLSGGSLLLE